MSRALGVIQTQPVLAGPQPGLEPREDWNNLPGWTIALFPRRDCWGFTKSGFAYENVNAIVAGRKSVLSWVQTVLRGEAWCPG